MVEQAKGGSIVLSHRNWRTLLCGTRPWHSTLPRWVLGTTITVDGGYLVE